MVDGALPVSGGSRPSGKGWQSTRPHHFTLTLNLTDIEYLAKRSLRVRKTVGRRAACISLSESSDQHFTSTRRPTTASRAPALRTSTIDTNLLELRVWHCDQATYKLYRLDGIGMRSDFTKGYARCSTNITITSTSGFISQGKSSRRGRMERARIRRGFGKEARMRGKGEVGDMGYGGERV